MHHARLETSGQADNPYSGAAGAGQLYASGRSALARSMALGPTVEDSADEGLAREAAAEVARLSGSGARR
jgi:hypothetical protein